MDYSPYEQMVVVLARDLGDWERGHVGGVRAEIPWAACLLAQKMQAPNLQIMAPPGMQPQVSAIVHDVGDYRLTRRCEALRNFGDIFRDSERGGLDWFFYSGLQIDKYGNFNLHFVGDWEKPTLRGPGLVFAAATTTGKHFYLYPIHHDKRVFVEKVDFISGAGHLDGPGGRERAGITTEGPRLCVTPRCVFDFDPESKVMRVKSMHRGITLDEVVGNMGFSPVLPGKLPTTEPPTTEELRLLREEIDPNSILRP